MSEFTISSCQIKFASIFGFLLFSMNFIIMSLEMANKDANTIICAIAAACLYVGLIINVLMEPTKKLRPLTKQEEEELEYSRVLVEDSDTSRKSQDNSLQKMQLQ